MKMGSKTSLETVTNQISSFRCSLGFMPNGFSRQFGRMTLACVSFVALLGATSVSDQPVVTRTVFDKNLRYLSKELQSVIRSSKYSEEYSNCYFHGAPLRASPDELELFFVTTYHSCNWFLAEGPIFVLGKIDGNTKVLLHSKGNSISYRWIENHPYGELRIVHNEYHSVFQFDGNQYYLVNRNLVGSGRRGGLPFLVLLISVALSALFHFYLTTKFRKQPQNARSHKK